MVSGSSSVKSIDDVFTHEVLMGGMGSGMVPTVVPNILNQLVGTRFRVVEGYAGTNAIFLAIERGEVEGLCMASSTLLGPSRNLIESGKLRILFSMESKPMAALPNVPTMFTRLKTEKQRQIVSFLNAALEYGRPFAAPPGVPSERSHGPARGLCLHTQRSYVSTPRRKSLGTLSLIRLAKNSSSSATAYIRHHEIFSRRLRHCCRRTKRDSSVTRPASNSPGVHYGMRSNSIL